MEPESEYFNPADPEDLQRKLRGYLEGGHKADKATLYLSDDPDVIPIGDIVRKDGSYQLYVGGTEDRSFELGSNVSQLRIFEKTGEIHTFIAREIYRTQGSYMEPPALFIFGQGPACRVKISIYLR